MHAIGPSRVVQSPMDYSRGPLSPIFSLFFRFVPQKGDKSPKEGLGLFLTHPPVVFGPHRSPRGEGHTIFRGRVDADPSPNQDPRMSSRFRSCNIWVTFWPRLFP